MAGKIIGWVVAFGCAILFYGIGVYAQKLEKPMWFWSGTEVDATKITDVAAGVAQIWSAIAYAIILVLSCTVGLAILIRTYQQISKKYSVK